MNIDRFIPVLPRTGLLLVAFASSLLLSACGGSDNKTNTSSSASLSSARSSYTAASVPANGSGDWPSVKVSAAATKTLKFEWSTAPNTTYYKLMKNNGGNSGYQQVGNNIPSTGANQSALDEIGVHVHDWINTRYLVEACNADGCSNSNETYTASAMLGTVGYLKASNAELGDFFGWSLALSADGMTLAVGAPAEDSNALSANGDQTSNTSICNTLR